MSQGSDQVQSKSKRMWVFIGGASFVGLLTIFGLFLQTTDFFINRANENSDTRIQATIIFIEGEQEDLLRELVTVSAGDSSDNQDEIRRIEEDIAEKEATIVALQSQLEDSEESDSRGESISLATTTIDQTMLPTDTPIPIFDPPNLLNPGETWVEEGVELTLEDYRFNFNELLLNWQVKNTTNQDVNIRYFNENFLAYDNNDRSMQVAGFVGCHAMNRTLGPGESVRSGDSNGCPLIVNYNPEDTSISEIVVVVTGIAGIQEASWSIPLLLQVNNALEAGDTWVEDDVEITLENYRLEEGQILTSWSFKNTSNHDIKIRYFNENFVAFDNNGEAVQVAGFVGCHAMSRTLGPAESVQSGDSNGCPLIVKYNPEDPSISEITVVVLGISRIEKASWQIPLSR